jgi:hypothetical protein
MEKDTQRVGWKRPLTQRVNASAVSLPFHSNYNDRSQIPDKDLECGDLSPLWRPGRLVGQAEPRAAARENFQTPAISTATSRLPKAARTRRTPHVYGCGSAALCASVLLSTRVCAGRANCPERGSATRSSLASFLGVGANRRGYVPASCCGSQSRAPLVAAAPRCVHPWFQVLRSN